MANNEVYSTLQGTKQQINHYLQEAPELSSRLRTLNNLPKFVYSILKRCEFNSRLEFSVKAYKSANSGLGGAISATLSTSGASNNLFTALEAADRLTGKDQFLCCYLKNTAAERILNFYFWLSATKTDNKTL